MNNEDLSQLPDWFLPIILVLVIWTMYWKAAALWQAAKSNKLNWFIILMLLNTVGILEIIYLFGVEKVKTDKLFK